ncbi:MAG: transcriptional regulator [Candidatus Dadabacteria bacterium]
MTDNHALKAKLFRGFADPSRLAVLEALRNGSKCVSDIVELTNLSQPNVSAHLACLEDCGLVKKEKKGRYVYYQVTNKKVLKLLAEVEAILAEVGEGIYRCTRY